MVWKWLSPRLGLQNNDTKVLQESSDLECLAPTSSGSASLRKLSSAGLLSDSLEVVSTTGITANTATVATAVHFVEHEVQRGEWLYDIGRRHNVDLSSLLKANLNLVNSDSLQVGIKIKIPCALPKNSVQSSPGLQSPVNVKNAVAVSATQPLLPSSQPEALTLSKCFWLLGGMLLHRREHKVVDGDSLEWIAEKYGTTVSALKQLNNLQDDLICKGRILKIEGPPTIEKSQTLLGSKLSTRERNLLMEGVLEYPRQPIKRPTTRNPSFKTYPLLQRGQYLKPPPRLKTVRVQFGDTLADIAYGHGLSIRELQQLNNLRNDLIFEGDVLAVSTVPSTSSFIDLRPGQRRTNRLLFSRQMEFSESCLGIESPQPITRTRHTKGSVNFQGHWERRSKGFQRQQDRWLRFSSPLRDSFVSSRFGWRWGALHEGVDLAADNGAPILASDTGIVTFTGWSGGYGYLVAIQHEGGFVTRYAHCCAIHTHVGQRVLKGQQVAAVGATGRATGPHLHFEVRRNGEALDPFKWVKL